MAKLPERAKQVAMMHAPLINSVVHTVMNPTLKPQLEPALQDAEKNGWTDLVSRIRRILDGERDTQLLVGLDEEDAAIILAILVGIQDPSQLPNPDQSGDPTMAATGLASIIDAAARGDVNALTVASEMAEQMVNAKGNMAQLGGIMRMLIDGERDLTVLCRNMDEEGKALVEAILDELAKLNPSRFQ